MRHAKKTLMALLFFLVALLAGNLAFAAPSASKDALFRKVIAFYCFDGTGKVTPSLRNLWQRQVRQAYPRVSYTFLDDPTILQKGRAGLLSLIQGGDELTAGDLERVTAATEADVVAVMVVHTMESYYVEALFPFWEDGPETYVRTLSAADFYLYRKEDGKFKKKFLRKAETKDAALATAPEKEIQYALSDFARSFEGLPLI